MNENIDVAKVSEYWLETSDEDFETMTHLMAVKKYNWTLFLGHIVIEKLLKSKVVKETGKSAPFTHNLGKLLILTGIELPQEQLDWIDTITTFNLQARYESYKRQFYKTCTPEYAQDWIGKIETLRQWIRIKH
ncbi:HEPN domain-containing protein [Dyadobacter arcticus]|uniref:HEPN domain-containing protein n=1 Tax=Dyadobacter arcticus TaxID=1078754 RepID=A0ABX0UE29_9BACT|nr:HEPN domain-containing protein [Dyadobacter arcticus]NIJ51256.1 HEPN domain-containing protein [Dyadobacter arcticus]